MLVTLPGIGILLKLEHPKNASFPMEVTLAGIVTLVRRVQPSKQYPGMDVDAVEDGDVGQAGAGTKRH